MKLREYKDKIKSIEFSKKIIYLNNSKYIFDYFENKKEISEGTNKTKILSSFFKKRRKKG